MPVQVAAGQAQARNSFWQNYTAHRFSTPLLSSRGGPKGAVWRNPPVGDFAFAEGQDLVVSPKGLTKDTSLRSQTRACPPEDLGRAGFGGFGEEVVLEGLRLGTYPVVVVLVAGR